MHGTKLAYVGRWALVLSLLGASGCLVTSRKQFPPEEELPATLTAPATAFPIDEVIRPYELTAAADGGSGPAQEIRLVVEVRDGNLDQDLEYRFLIRNGADVTTPPECPAGIPNLRFCGTIPATGVLERTLELPVPISDLGDLASPRCVRLELLVSDAFDALSAAPGSFRSEIVWWVDGKSSQEAMSAPVSECPESFL